MAEKIIAEDIENKASFYCEHEPVEWDDGQVFSFKFNVTLQGMKSPNIVMRFCKKCRLVYWEYKEEKDG